MKMQQIKGLLNDGLGGPNYGCLHINVALFVSSFPQRSLWSTHSLNQAVLILSLLPQ